MDIVIPCHRPSRRIEGLLTEIVEKTEQPYTLHVIAHQESAAFNRNLGLDSATSDIMIMLDDDIEKLPLYWNRLLVKPLAEDESILAVSARLMTADGQIGKNTANNTDLSKDLVEVGMIPTACCAFRVPENGTKFDEDFDTAGWEDTDFMRAYQKASPGKKFVINNVVQVVHRNEEKNGGGAGNTRNRRVFMEKWYSPRRFNNLAGITKRGCVDVGHPCDIDCEMCYHRHEDRSKRRFMPKEEIMRRMKRDRDDFELECIDFTGGEPTLHPDIVEIVAYGREIGLPVCIISHGQWKKPEKTKEIIEAGPHEFLLSIHGVEADHDAVVNPGAYQAIMTSIDLLEEAGVPWRANCVTTNRNAKNLAQYARELVALPYPPGNVNFIVFNPFSDWAAKGDIDFQARHSELAPHISESIGVFDEHHIWCNVRYFPMCMLPGQEKHVTCFPQIVCDPLEWDVRSYCDLGAETIESVYQMGRHSGVFGESEEHIFFNTWGLHNSLKIYRKPPACMRCRNRLICDGLAHQYRARYGAGELRSQEGELIVDPIHYRRNTPGVQG